MTIGEALRAAREKAGLTQTELAQKMNVTVSCVSQYERDRRNPGTRQLEKFADALGISYDVLLVSKIDDLTQSRHRNDIADLFSQTEFSEKLMHIGYALNEVDSGAFIIESPTRKYAISGEELLNLNEKCDSYLRFLLSELK
ncbi:MAG: helix-turn-helix transcriptional regulator [Oscillospiraceae bacterium]|nr:helix-turn-helix transcriptional regulator [Oscillospiraceae bacterium]